MNTPLVNGIAYHWANINLVLFGVPVVGIRAISYKRKQAKENIYGAGVKPIARGYGNEEYEGSIELLTDEWKAIIAGSPNNNPLEISPFDIPVIFEGEGVPFGQDTLRMVEFLEDPLATKQGDTSITVTIPLIIGGIDRNG